MNVSPAIIQGFTTSTDMGAVINCYFDIVQAVGDADAFLAANGMPSYKERIASLENGAGKIVRSDIDTRFTVICTDSDDMEDETMIVVEVRDIPGTPGGDPDTDGPGIIVLREISRHDTLEEASEVVEELNENEFDWAA